MTNLMYFHELGYDFVISDGDDEVRILMETDEFPYLPTKEQAVEFLNSIEDDSSWPIIDKNNVIADTTELVAIITKEL